MARRGKTRLIRGEETRRSSIQVRESVYTAITKRARALGWSRAALIRHLLERDLERIARAGTEPQAEVQ